jgi:tetratricopeptide (TPR) repeat protein
MNITEALRQRREELAAIRIALNLPGSQTRQLSLLEALQLLGQIRTQGNLQLAWELANALIGDGRAATEAKLVKLGICMELQRLREGHQLVRELEKLDLNDPAGMQTLASAMHALNLIESANRLLDKGLQQLPDDATLLELRAVVRMNMNRRSAALADWRQLAQRHPEPRARALGAIAALAEPTADELARLEKLAAAGTTTAEVYFGLASVARRRGELDREFEWLDKAHAVAAVNLPAWNPDDEAKALNELIRLFDRAWLNSHRAEPPADRQPIFIVGMPRSGSTLIESLLLGSPGVGGTLGESQLYESLVAAQLQRRQLGGFWPTAISRFGNEDLGQIAAGYSSGVTEIYTDAASFVDKKLENAVFLGLLAQSFPRAKFVHALRHPMGTILSSYQQNLRYLPDSHSLEHLARKYRMYMAVLDHWKAQIPDRIYTLEYEKLVTDPATESRALFEFCELPWDESVLEIQRLARPVRTASLFQVRESIHTRSADDWQRYSEHLAPARAILED